MPEYPSEWESDVVLADGSTIRIRPIRPDDAGRLAELHSRLSPDTIYFRFFSPLPRLSEKQIERFTNVDYRDRMALVAVADDRVVAVARYDSYPTVTEAEAAFVVEDALQGKGLGMLLLEHLAAVARTHGITRLVAHVLPQNRRMLDVFRKAGFARESELDEGVVRVMLGIEPSEEATERIAERERHATARSIERLLRPTSIAVIGASRERGTIGNAIFRNLLAGGFQGPVYPVHPTAAHIGSVRSYPSVLDIPDEVDLAVIAVPAPAVPSVVRQCGQKRVRGLVVISAGFAETGTEGAAAERELVRIARVHGMRMIGPNCMGVVNAAPTTAMNASFAPVQPTFGRVSFSSQSGALGIAILDESTRLGLGVSTFVSMGNKADVSGNDLLQYWEEDEDTDVILLYLESFGNPRKFSKLARRVSREKPIVAVKSGRTTSGTRAAASHTAALASSDVAVDALFRQAGVIRVDTLEALFDVAQVLAQQPLPAGPRVGIVTNAGGPGILAADTCEALGLDVPELSADTQARLRSFLPGAAGVGNPVDLVASATAEQFEQGMQAVLDDSAVDSLLVIFIPPLVTRAEDVADSVARVAQSSTKPVVTNFLALGQPPAALYTAGVPVFAYPEQAVHAMARVHSYAEWRARAEGSVPHLDTAREEACALVAGRLAGGDGAWLPPDEAFHLLSLYGIPTVATEVVADPAEAAAAAEKIGFPVAIKAADVLHKSDVGGVRLNLRSHAEVKHAAAAVLEGAGGGRVIVQKMVSGGVETVVGVTQDPSFGPLLMFGSGGTAVEVLGDQAFRILPLTDVDARELIQSTRVAKLLAGHRGTPRADVEALEDVLLRVACLAEEIPEIAELDLNPVLVSENGAVAVDARVRVEPYEAHPELSVRRLR